MSTIPVLPEALAAEYALRAKRATAVAAVSARLQAARTEAEAQSETAATVAALLRARVGHSNSQRERLEAERASALAPTPEVVAAQAALAAAIDRSRAVPIGDDAAATAAAHAQADAEDVLKAAQLEAEARNVRPLALRLQMTLDQAGAAARELVAAEIAADAAEKDLRRALIGMLRLRRDAAALAFDEAVVDLVLASGAQHSDSTQMTLGESDALLTELGKPLDFYFGKVMWRTRDMGRFDAALVLDQVAPTTAADVAPRRPQAGEAARSLSSAP